ncbi:amidase family protein [Pseudonocardia sp. ICBG1293]|uniref:amidase family protein n=1 Tax=Pseudonocardia sp. ICBG1293 TaxID=2844382 RepID=UPI001CCC6C28|nr:amidase family protein [Pseudonocardia sp. ICBG1293]
MSILHLDEPSSTSDDGPSGVPDLAAAVREGRLSAATVAERLLTAIDDAVPDGVGLVVDPGALRAAAAALDRRTDRFALPLAGVPVVVEDGISVAGRGDEVVRRLRAAGALVAGWARTAEHEVGLDGTPGGRATAAVVASGAVPLGIGVDGDGTLRCAAAAHGIAALKPGRRVLPVPDAAERRWCGLAEPTLLARHPDDLTTVLDALSRGAAGPPAPSSVIRRAAPADTGSRPPAAPVSSLAASLRTGRTRLAGPDAASAVHAAIRLLQDDGLGLVAADPPYRAVLVVHSARRRQAGLARRVEDLGLDPAELPRSARSLVRRGRRVRRLGGLRPATPASWRQRMVAWLDDAGAEAGLLPAPPGASGAGSTGVAAWNLAGLPSLVAPVHRSGEHGCVQLVGRPGSERRLLATAALLARG